VCVCIRNDARGFLRRNTGGEGRRALNTRETGPTEPDGVELIMRFHPVGGEDISVMSRDFGGEGEALEVIARALDERRCLILTQARYDREAGGSGVIVNLANVVSVRVSRTDSEPSGQYL